MNPSNEPDARLGGYGDVPDVIVWEADAGLAFTFVSPQAEALLGYPPERWLSDPAFGLARIHPDDRVRVRELLRAEGSNAGSRSFDCRMVAADGRVRWFRNLASLNAVSGGAPTWHGILIDITRCKETELGLRQDVDGYRQIAETAAQGIWRIDDRARIVFVNRKMAALLGYAEAELRGRDLFELMDPPGARASLGPRLVRGSHHEHDLVFVGKDGRKIWATAAVTPLFDEQGRDSGSIGVVTDVTAQRRTNALLTAQRAVFELLVGEEPDSLHKALDKLVRAIEGILDGVSASVLLLDPDGQRLWVGAAPNLPAAYNAAIHGARIGPAAGSCGTAAYRKELVVTADIQADPLWIDYRDLAAAHGLRACWSSPILNRSRRVLGTFAMYFRDVRRPTEDELQFVSDATAAAALVIEHVETRRSLAHTISLLEATLESTADGILVVDTGGTVQRYNRRVQEQWHIPDDLMQTRDGNRILAFCAALLQDPATAATRVEELREASPDTVALDTLELKDGRVFERYFQSQTIDSVQVGRAWSFRDVTRRKQAERALKESEHRFRVLSDAASEAIMIHQQGQIRLANEGTARMFGYEPSELTGMNALDFCHPDTRAQVREMILSPEDQTYVSLGLRKDQSTFWGEVRSRVTEFQGRPARVTCVRDVSDRKSLEEAREKNLQQERSARLEAERSIKLYDDFLAIASHELKTPLTPLKMYLQLLRHALGEQPLPDARRSSLLLSALQNTDREYNHLLRLIDDLLDVSTITAGRLVLTRERCDLSQIVQEVLARLAPELARARCAVQFVPRPGVEGSWDRRRVDQLVTILLSNALKYGAGRPIELAVSQEHGTARLAVGDQGIGIAPADQAKIFERFARRAPIENYGGLGLGLYIAEHIVVAHGGTISVASESGKGARFVVELPAGPVPHRVLPVSVTVNE